MKEKRDIGRVSVRTKMGRAVWNVACALLFRPFPTELFHTWRWLVLRAFGAQVARDAVVYSSVKLWAPWLLRMDHGACLGPEVVCYNQDWVVMEEGAIVSQYSYLCTAGHDTGHANTADAGLLVAPIVLHKGAWVGSRAFIGMGVEVGEGAIVGATASVYKDVEPWSVVGGNPAKLIKMRNIKRIKSGGVKRRALSLESDDFMAVLHNKERRAA